MQNRGFERAQGSVFASKDNDLASLFSAVMALRTLGGLGGARSARAFRFNRGSDVTAIVKAQPR